MTSDGIGSHTPWQTICHATSFYVTKLTKCMPFSMIGAFFVFLPTFLFAEHFKIPNLAVFTLATDVVALAFSLLSWFFAIIAFSANIFYLFNLQSNNHTSYARTFRWAFKDCFPLLLVMMLYLVIVVCGTMLFVLPGIVFAVSLMLGPLIRITEKRGILDALTDSHGLVWGHWWSSAIIISIPLLVHFILSSIALILLFMLLQNLALPHVMTQSIIAISQVLLLGLIAPYLFSTALVLLHDLKLK